MLVERHLDIFDFILSYGLILNLEVRGFAKGVKLRSSFLLADRFPLVARFVENEPLLIGCR